MKLTSAQREFLEELAYDNPEPKEVWKRRENWDPMFPLAVIDAAAKKGLIETTGERSSNDYAYRFLPAGRDALKALEGER